MSSVDLGNVSARGPAERGRARAVITDLTLQADSGVLAIVGGYRDGSALLFDLIDGTAKPSAGQVTVLGESADAARARVSRVSLDAPLPPGLRVDELSDLASELRSEPRRPAKERLAILGAGALEKRWVGTLTIAERRTVSLALALTSSKSEVILVEEPLVGLDPVAPRLVLDALRSRASTACVIVTTASPREAVRLGDRLGLLSKGVYTPVDWQHPLSSADRTSSRIVLARSEERTRIAALVAALTADEAVIAVETLPLAGAGSVVVNVAGRDLGRLANSITRAIAGAGVAVELVEPSALSLDAFRTAMAARAASPPPGSLPPGPGTMPPAAAASPATASPAAGASATASSATASPVGESPRG